MNCSSRRKNSLRFNRRSVFAGVRTIVALMLVSTSVSAAEVRLTDDGSPKRDPVFIVRLNEDSDVGPLSWVEDSRPYEDHHDWIAHTRDTLADRGLDKKRIGLDYDSFFLRTRDEKRLTAALPSAAFVDGAGLVEQGRVVKSAREIEHIRHAPRQPRPG